MPRQHSTELTRRILRLYHRQGLSVLDIADHLWMSPRTIHSIVNLQSKRAARIFATGNLKVQPEVDPDRMEQRSPVEVETDRLKYKPLLDAFRARAKAADEAAAEADGAND